jgi:hypothetical protein
MAMLSKAAFVEEDYPTAEAHARAMVILTSYRLATLPHFIWLLVVYADLRLTSVISRAPLLPYCIHSHFRINLPSTVRKTALSEAQRITASLPTVTLFAGEEVTILFQLLYGHVWIFDNDRAVLHTSTSYKLMYRLAVMQALMTNHLDHGACESEHNVLAAVLLGIRIQASGMMSSYIHQDAMQRSLLRQILLLLSNHTPRELGRLWQDPDRLDVLLWILFNASISILCCSDHFADTHPWISPWLLESLTHVMHLLRITSLDLFEASLKKFPFSKHWNGKRCAQIYDCTRTGTLQR